MRVGDLRQTVYHGEVEGRRVRDRLYLVGGVETLVFDRDGRPIHDIDHLVEAIAEVWIAFTAVAQIPTGIHIETHQVGQPRASFWRHRTAGRRAEFFKIRSSMVLSGWIRHKIADSVRKRRGSAQPISPSRGPSAADSQRGGFATDYPGRKQGLGRLCERTEWRERKSSNDNGELTRMFLRGLPRGFSEEVHLGGRLRFS